VVSNNRRISDVLRAKGGLVVWVRVDINQAIRPPVDVPMPFEGKHLPSELMEIAPTAGFQDGDLLITKYHWGGFAGTPLEQQLRARDIDTIILTGISTNMGVESTLRQGTGWPLLSLSPKTPARAGMPTSIGLRSKTSSRVLQGCGRSMRF